MSAWLEEARCVVVVETKVARGRGNRSYGPTAAAPRSLDIVTTAMQLGSLEGIGFFGIFIAIGSVELVGLLSILLIVAAGRITLENICFQSNNVTHLVIKSMDYDHCFFPTTFHK